ncbi:SDR family NAD(P)-dependent oxidoreductase [Paraburkholderia sp. HP33-1]|uniref:SDR family NAD(P)-dependent oxidoreductase n=1 Tax=Paraburkholderia sp. HP33-1 TaxID=2883243 RepID=UPI001F487FC0|nr:SDR family NAD(P)-dependent oxidoreductase [Paraburkholderia sp. HP33-1]
MSLLSGKTCLITGGAGSIGMATARLFLEHGARVMLVDLDPSLIESALASLANPDAAGIAADVGDADDTKRFVTATVQRFGKIDAVFANAGVFGQVAPVTDYPDEVFDLVMRVAVRGSFLTCKHAIPAMNDGGSIVLMSSVMGLTADPGVAAYATSKHAVVGLMRVLAKELAPRRIRVNSVHPGPVANEFQTTIERSLDHVLNTDATAFLDNVIPLHRHADAAEIANSVLYLASSLSSFVTGATLPVDGGMSS